ncbi:MAG TPA: hypothetical protein VEA99_10970, partial [Gemmatimonadaceae bacterium]|nr:hypothetical protein [Gemmatimonadaceae bacterium]
ALGPSRLLWGCDLTMCTGLAKLRALEVIGLEAEGLRAIRWENAVRIFPKGAFPGLPSAAGPRPSSDARQPTVEGRRPRAVS